MPNPNPPSAVIAIKSKSSHSPSPSPPSGSPPKDAAYLKRREQVRRAQRTHRERKENYIKALEEQVLDLRTKQREIVRENAALTSEVVQLRGLVHSDVSVSAGGGEGSSSRELGGENVNAWMMGTATGNNGSSTSDVWGGGENDMTGWQLSGFSSAVGTTGEAWNWGGSGGMWVGGHTGGPSSTALALAHTSRRPTPSRTSELDCTDLAVEFVMTLEKPCINRATSTVLDLGERNVDYALQVPSTGIYHTFLEDNVLPEGRKEVDASDSLDKLLALSANFKLVGEVTPIQAWQQIVSHPQFRTIGIETMRRLVEQLLWHVKCYGFGAVINMSIFNELIKNVFVA